MKKIILIIYLLVVFPFISFAQSPINDLVANVLDLTVQEQIDDWTLYFFTTDKEITIAWDVTILPDPPTVIETDYDLYLYHVERKEIIVTANIPQVDIEPSAQITLQLPVSGHYFVFIRSVKEPLTIDDIAMIDDAPDMLALKNYVTFDNDTSSVCDYEIWWDDNATLDEMKTIAKAQKGLCSIYVESFNSEYAKVTIDDIEVEKGWWLYGHVAPPTGGGIN